jgi:hypothetical protein
MFDGTYWTGEQLVSDFLTKYIGICMEEETKA